MDLTEWTREEQVAHTQYAAEAKEARDALECDRLPQVRELVECVSREDEVGRVASVLVREKSAPHALHIAELPLRGLLAQSSQHCRRHVHRHHAKAKWCSGKRQGSSTCTEIDQRRGVIQAKRA